MNVFLKNGHQMRVEIETDEEHVVFVVLQEMYEIGRISIGALEAHELARALNVMAWKAFDAVCQRRKGMGDGQA